MAMPVIDIPASRLVDLSTPARTRTHVPIPHADVHNAMVGALASRGLILDGEPRVQLMQDGARAIGTIPLAGRFGEGGSQAQYTVAWRNAHDKSSSVILAAGHSVLICSNGQIIAQTVLRRRHTSDPGGWLEDLVTCALERLDTAMAREESRALAYRRHALPDTTARAWITRLAEHEVFPSSRILDVYREFAEPSFNYGEGLNVWRLNAAVTHDLKRVNNPALRQDRSLKLGRLLDTAVGLN